MTVAYYVHLGYEPLMSTSYSPIPCVLITATFGNGDWLPDVQSGPYDTRNKARRAARKLARERNMPAYDTSTIRPYPLY